MKIKIAIFLCCLASAAHALNPPSERPAVPACSLRQAMETAEAEVRKIDANYYCFQAGYQYGYMKPQSPDFPEDHWLLRFVRSNSRPKPDGTGYDDLEVRVSLDGRKTSVTRD